MYIHFQCSYFYYRNVISYTWMPIENLELSWEMGKSIHLIWGDNVEACAHCE
jgi:hypothetical protein